MTVTTQHRGVQPADHGIQRRRRMHHQQPLVRFGDQQHPVAGSKAAPAASRDRQP